jgi:hypothetical protein
LTVLLALSACTTRERVAEAPVVAPVETPPPETPAAAVKKPPPKPAPPADTKAPDITLAGLSRPEVMATLGDPQEQKDSNPGRTWIYHSGTCTVEILFLLDVTRNDEFVVDSRLDGTDGTPRGEQACLKRIASQHAKRVITPTS